MILPSTSCTASLRPHSGCADTHICRNSSLFMKVASPTAVRRQTLSVVQETRQPFSGRWLQLQAPMQGRPPRKAGTCRPATQSVPPCRCHATPGPAVHSVPRVCARLRCRPRPAAMDTVRRRMRGVAAVEEVCERSAAGTPAGGVAAAISTASMRLAQCRRGPQAAPKPSKMVRFHCRLTCIWSVHSCDGQDNQLSHPSVYGPHGCAHPYGLDACTCSMRTVMTNGGT